MAVWVGVGPVGNLLRSDLISWIYLKVEEREDPELVWRKMSPEEDEHALLRMFWAFWIRFVAGPSCVS